MLLDQSELFGLLNHPEQKRTCYKIIKNSFFVFSDLIDKKKRDLIDYSRQLANTEAITQRFQLINDKQFRAESSVHESFYYEMLNQLVLIGLTNKNINKVTLYNNDGRLMAFYHFYDNVIDIGAYQHSRKHYIVARVESAKPLTPLTNRTTPLPLDWSSCYSNI